MATFIYKASDSQNNISQATIVAPSAEEVAASLKKQGLNPLSIQPTKNSTKVVGHVPAIEKIALCRYLTTMLASGVPLTSGIPALKKETKNPLMRQILDDILYNLEQGQPLSAAFSNYPNAFEKFFITLVKSGEVSGTLSDSFKYLERQLRAEYSLSQKVKSALVYPTIVVVAMMGIGFLMFFFVLPQIGKVFTSMTIPLPQFTRNIFNLAIIAGQYRYPLIGSIVIAMIGLFLFISKPTGKRVVISLISPIPIVNRLLQQIDIARFCRIFSTLIASAVPITDALDIALSSLSHPKFRSLAQTIPKQVVAGKSIADSFSENQAFPALLTQMISAGEKSGTIDTSLADLADFYEEEVEEAVKKTTQMLEPLVMLVVGIGVGAMILMIIAPLYSVVGSLQLEAQGK